MRSTGMARVLSECFRKIGKGSRGADCEALTAPSEEASRHISVFPLIIKLISPPKTMILM